MAVLRARRVYPISVAAALLGRSQERSVRTRAETVEKKSNGTRAVLWPGEPRTNDVVWAAWFDTVLYAEGADPGDGLWEVRFLPDLPGMPAEADVTVIGADIPGIVDPAATPTPTLTPSAAPNVELERRYADVSAQLDAARAETKEIELDSLRRQLELTEARLVDAEDRVLHAEANAQHWRTVAHQMSANPLT